MMTREQQKMDRERAAFEAALRQLPDTTGAIEYALETFDGERYWRDQGCSGLDLNGMFVVWKLARASLPAAGSAEEEVEVVAFDWPEYHYQAMGCGLEDRGITDRYEAMQYGWDCAIERCAEIVPDEPLMTVAQHERIVAALSAQKSAHVSVPRELLDAVKELFDAKLAKEDFERENPGNSTKRWDACLYRIDAAEDALRALLNGGEA